MISLVQDLSDGVKLIQLMVSRRLAAHLFTRSSLLDRRRLWVRRMLSERDAFKVTP